MTSVAITPDGQRAVSGSWDCTLKVWDLDRRLECGLSWVMKRADRRARLTPEGRYAVSGAHDLTIKVWNLEADLDYSPYQRSAHAGPNHRD